MDTFENVHVFSNTTAEISQEYIDKFHKSEIMPNYLHELSQKAGVELLSRDGAYEVKGSWLSVNRAHSFLGKFLLTYGQTRVDTVTTVSDTTLSNEETDEHEFINRKTLSGSKRSLETDGSESPEKGEGSSAGNIDQRLPPDKVMAPKSQPRLPPEPVVLYAGYQVSKEVESRRKTLEVLKNVYKMEQNYQIGAVKEVNNDENQEELIQEDGTEQHQQVMSENPVSVTEEINTTTDSHDVENSTIEDANSQLDVISGVHKIKEEECNKSDSSGVKRTSTVKSFTKEETAAKRKKVESIAENILSNVPMKETVNVVSNEENSIFTTNDTITETTEENREEEALLHNVKNEAELETGLDNKMSEDECNDGEESDFKDDLADKDYSGDTEIESEDEGNKSPSDHEYVPEKKVSVPKIKTISKRKTRRSKTKADLISLQPPKRGRGRPRKGFPMKLEVKLPPKSASKKEAVKAVKTVKEKKKQLSGAQKRRGRPKRTTSDVPKEYHCNKCPYFANKRCHLREHERRVHITKEFKCEHCDKIFGFGKDLKRHLKTHLKPQNCCDICGKLYKGVKSLVEHRRTHDDGYVKPEFECEICKKNFSTKYVLAYHIKSEHLGMKRTFMCPTCGKSFSQKNSYLQHANVHMGFKPHKCEVCGKAFSYEKSLKEHRFMHDDIRRFKCQICDKTFRQSSAVTIHMKVHKETKDYVCMACGKGFSQKQALIRHERIHLGEKPFSCGLCGRNFTDSSILRRHMILIHKKDPKKWREDTINNTVRRTDFFIDVLPGMVDEEQDKDVPIKEPNVHTGDDALNTPHPELLCPPTGPSVTEPINMTTQGSSRERHIEEEFQSQVQSIPELEPEQSEEQSYHIPITHIHSDPITLSQDSVNHVDKKIVTIQNHSGIHPGVELQSQGQVGPQGQVGLQGQLDVKADGGDYLPAGIPQHSYQYAMMGQGGYAYPHMVMMQDSGAQYQTQSTVTFTNQYPDQNTAQQYPTTFHPAQS